MTAQSKTVIKSYFETGDKPTQAQFADLVDSYVDVSSLPANIGTVVSAGLSMPGIFAVAGSPITTAGNFVVTMSAQAQATVLAAPASAGGVPSFRPLVASDIPTAATAYTLLQTITASNSPTIDFNSGISSTYSKYIVEVSNVIIDTDMSSLRMRLNIGSGFDTSSSYTYNLNIVTGGTNSAAGTTTTSFNFNGNSNMSSGSSGFGSFTVNMLSRGTASLPSVFTLSGNFYSGSSAAPMSVQGGMSFINGAVQGIRFFMSAGNIASGTFKLYGIT